MSTAPRVAFFGSPALAEACFRALRKTFDVCMTVTQPGKAAGRGRTITPTPLARAAGREGIPLYEPPSVRAGFSEVLAQHGVELIVVVAYGKLLPREVVDFPPLGSVNLHASLLPRHRGASPIQSALLSGDRVTGITVQKMKREMDAGDVLGSLEIEIGPEWTAERLLGRITETAPAFLRETLERHLAGRITPVPQREEDATYCSLIRKEDGLVDWGGDPERICGRIRAFNVWPVCHTSLDGKTLRIYDARSGGPVSEGARGASAFPLPEAVSVSEEASGSSAVPGEILAVDRKEGIVVRAGTGTGAGTVKILELQLENKKRMGHRDFANGYRNLTGRILGSTRPPARPRPPA